MTESQFREILSRLTCFFPHSEEDMFTEYLPLKAEISVTKEPVAWEDRDKLSYKPLEEGTAWGGYWDSCWVHLTGRVPRAWGGKCVVMRLNLGGESLVFDAKGNPYGALTNHSLFDRFFTKDVFRFGKPFKGGEKIDLWVEGVASNIQGQAIFPWDPHSTREKYPAGRSNPVACHLRLALFNDELYHFRLEFQQLLELVTRDHASGGLGKYYTRLLVNDLSKALDVYCGNPDNAAAAREALKPAYARHAASSALNCTAVGHAHIDVGWLWPVSETVRKVARTYSNQLRLMERYPEYVFGGSQPQLYEFAKKHYPGLYEQVRRRIAEGRWECQGGMWVEADNNLPSGESLIRQFLYGKNFFRDEFGVEVRNLWLPDVFGYNGNTPQIMKICGCDYFLTQKLSWNKTNAIPYNTFQWEGIDGTRVTTHFPPADNYNSAMRSGELAAAQDRYRDSAICNDFIELFGIGDGGGGPCEDHVERARLVRDLEGVPKVKIGPAQAALERIGAIKEELPVWKGELYFEKHRGTLTTQAETKRNNRKLEQLIQQAEFLAALLPAEMYPRKRFDEVWKKILINQFHDIIPGSSIKLVYDNTKKEHEWCFAELHDIIKECGKKLMKGRKNTLTLFNSLGFPYTRPVELPREWANGKVRTGDGEEVATQVEADGRVFASVKVPEYGFRVLKFTPGANGAARTKTDHVLTLENQFLVAAFNNDGQVVAISSEEFTPYSDEVLKAPGNVLGYYVDEPAEYDAWDVDPWYRRELVATAKARPGYKAFRETGPVRDVLHFELVVGNSTVTQEVSLAHGQEECNYEDSMLEFKTRVDWHENRKMLRVSFPTTIRSDEATFDIQYGFVRRPTHTNTSWDYAKFEVCAHKYADISTSQAGVALANDCKYAYMVRDGVLDLALLRSPKWPDYYADQGEHEFTYALCPHNFPFEESWVIERSAQLNREPLRFDGRILEELIPPFYLDDANTGVSVEVVKRAEKSDAYILRLVELQGRESSLKIVFDDRKLPKRMVAMDALEWNEKAEEGIFGRRELMKGIVFMLKPFEIETVKIEY